MLGKNPDVVSWWVGEGVRLRLEDSEFAHQLEDLDREMARSAGARDGAGGSP